MRKPIQIGLSATENGKRLEMSDLGSGGIIVQVYLIITLSFGSIEKDCVISETVL